MPCTHCLSFYVQNNCGLKQIPIWVISEYFAGCFCPDARDSYCITQELSSLQDFFFLVRFEYFIRRENQRRSEKHNSKKMISK